MSFLGSDDFRASFYVSVNSEARVTVLTTDTEEPCLQRDNRPYRDTQIRLMGLRKCCLYNLKIRSNIKLLQQKDWNFSGNVPYATTVPYILQNIIRIIKLNNLFGLCENVFNYISSVS